MGKQTGISWSDSTFNPWRGCTKVSEGCKFCYAERDSHRNPGTLGIWGPKGTRVVASEAKWREVLEWDADAASRGERRKVFCASLADVFEQWTGPMVNSKGWPGLICGRDTMFTPLPPQANANQWRRMTMDDCRLRLFDTIRQTYHLDWLLLTKRPEAIWDTLQRCQDQLITRAVQGDEEFVHWLGDWIDCGQPPENVWLGTSVEDQATADARIGHILKVPAAVHWVSYEPALAAVDWSKWFAPPLVPGNDSWDNPAVIDPPDLDWIIVGGESGAKDKARPFDMGWAIDTIRQCRDAGVACFVKQLGANPFYTPRVAPDVKVTFAFNDRAGADPDEWLSDLRVREFPR